ncbi:unnamed protein product, partial [Discosporangium mesarthrocarpum]
NGVWFDGKIGIWPIVDIVLAKRDSKNRKKGTPMMKPAKVNGERYKKFIIEEVIPAIKARMPRPPHDLRAAGWCKVAHGKEGHEGNPGCGGRRYYPGNPACQLT